MVYAFILSILLLVFQPIFTQTVDKVRGATAAKAMINIMTGNPIDNLFKVRGEGGLLNEVDNLDQEIAAIQKQITEVKGVLAIVAHLDDESKQNTIALCLNVGQCDGVPSSLLGHLTLLRNYVILNRLEGEKMDFDQKTILKSITEFLLKNTGGVGGSNLLSITFQAPETIDENFKLYKLPFTLTVEFPNKTALINFLTNIDTKMTFDLPILYAVETMTYDAMNYESEQTVTVNMGAYYYIGDIKQVMQAHTVAGEGGDWGEDLAELIDGDTPTSGSIESGSINDAIGSDVLSGS